MEEGAVTDSLPQAVESERTWAPSDSAMDFGSGASPAFTAIYGVHVVWGTGSLKGALMEITSYDNDQHRKFKPPTKV